MNSNTQENNISSHHLNVKDVKMTGIVPNHSIKNKDSILIEKTKVVQINNTMKHIISASLATSVAEVITFPLCTLKTNYQNSNNVSMANTMRNIWIKRGIVGFYNASGWAITSQILSTTTKYTLYQTLKDVMPNKFIAGALSGALSTIITHPIDVIKIHYQMHTPVLPELRQNGLQLFYRGYSKSLIKASVGSFCFFPLFDIFNGYTRNASMAAMLSGIVSTTIIQPLDYMKTRQIYGQSFFSGWNPRPYLKGLSLNLMRVVPHFIITMTLIEYMKQNL